MSQRMGVPCILQIIMGINIQGSMFYAQKNLYDSRGVMQKKCSYEQFTCDDHDRIIVFTGGF